MLVLAGALILVLATPALGGVAKHPRPGTYSGVATGTTDSSLEVRLGFTVHHGMLLVQAAEGTIPDCSGGLFMTDATIVKGKFASEYVQPSPSETNRLKGRFTSRTRITGKVVLERPDSSSCGDPGTYTYRFAARRYGKP